LENDLNPIHLKHTHLSWLLVGLMAFSTAHANPTDSPQPDRAAPEAVTFLTLAMQAAQRYKNQQGVYPKTWHAMRFSYANGPYHQNDRGLRATKKEGALWQPQKAHYRYVMSQPSGQHFQIQAIDVQTGQPDYVIQSGQTQPTALTR
jgi:hypothetical protein